MEVKLAIPACREGMAAEQAGRSWPRPMMVFAVAVLHIAALSALGLVLQARRLPPPAAQAGIPVVFAPPAPPQAAPPQAAPAPAAAASSSLASVTLPVQTEQEPATLAPQPPLAFSPSAPSLVRRPSPRPARRRVGHADPAVSRPIVANQAAPAPPAAAAPRQDEAASAGMPSNDTLRAMANWEARIRQAVQDAAIYPASARLLHRTGSAQVRFDYDRGTIEHAAVAQTSHVEALDSAALAAVTRAAIPAPPKDLGPQPRTMLVWVRFQLLTED